MNRFILIVPMIVIVATVSAQNEPPTSSPAATASDVETLRQQVQALTETVKTLQQQMKDQQAVLEKANIAATPALPQKSETPATSDTAASAASSATPPPLIPTEDSSVVASSGAPPAVSPGVNAN
jgi:hypothetical protein